MRGMTMRLPLVLIAVLVAVVGGFLLWMELSGEGGSANLQRPLSPSNTASAGRAAPNTTVVLDKTLLEASPTGMLPRVGPRGRKPWQVYRMPGAETARKPALAVIVTNLGLKATVTKAAIDDLPAAVTLAFSPYASGLADLARAARLTGHEILLAVPMEPIGYPSNDPGEQTLLTTFTAVENIKRLHWSMARFGGYVGVVPFMGERFLGSRTHLEPVIREVNARGLLFVDPGSGRSATVLDISARIGVPTAHVRAVIDDTPARAAIAERLDALAAAARSTGYAVALGRPYPATIETLSAWLKSPSAKTVNIVPVSAIAAAGRGAR